MKKMIEFFKRKYEWAAVMAVLLSISTTFTLLDAFVIPKSYASAAQVKSGNSSSGKVRQEIVPESQGSSTQAEADTTDYSYKDDDISINVEKLNEDGSVFYVADIQVSDVKYLRTAFANNTFGKNITQPTSQMAKANNAIFAINGDYYGFRDTGLIIRNGVLYRDAASNSPDNQTLTINSKGEMEIVTEGKASGSSLIKTGILQSFSFGPVLVQDGKLAVGSSSMVSKSPNPRTAIGQISPLHYIVIVVDGRSNKSYGMTLEQLAKEFVDRGAKIAYNLDGGGSTTMWLNGMVINNPTDGRSGGERSVSDIIYIGK